MRPSAMIAPAHTRFSPWLANEIAPPRVGPMQGLQPAAKAMPTRKVPKNSSLGILSARLSKTPLPNPLHSQPPTRKKAKRDADAEGKTLSIQGFPGFRAAA